MDNKENKSGRPVKSEKTPFTGRFRKMVGTATQQEIADKIGTSRQNVGKWISGTTSPDILALSKIACAYKVSTDYLLGLTPNKTSDPKLQEVQEYTGLSERSIENICQLTKCGKNVDILLEYDKLNDIVELLNQIRIINIIKRYFSMRINGDFKSDEIIKSATNNYNAFGIFSNSIKVSLDHILRDNFNIDIELIYPYSRESVEKGGSDKGFFDKFYEKMDKAHNGHDEKQLNEKSILKEYEFTEHIIRNLIDLIKQGNEDIDNEAFKEFDYLIYDNLTLKTAFELSFFGKFDTMPGETDEQKKEIKDELEALIRLQSHFKETYGKKDGDPNAHHNPPQE